MTRQEYKAKKHGSDSTDQGGSANAAIVGLGLSQNIDIFYDIASGGSGDIVVEVTNSGKDAADSEWDEAARVSVSGSVQDWIYGDTREQYARAYAEGIADSNVNEVRISKKGD